MKLKFNPFFDAGIANYEQYKQFPFLISSNIKIIKNRISQEIEQIENGYLFSDRLILLGMRGVGKTSTLFFIQDMLKKKNIRTILLSRLPEDAEHFEILAGEEIGVGIFELSKKPVYILIDFPDDINSKSLKNFLNFLWAVITHKNYNKINLIFAMNISHYDKSFMFSEILGKFLTIRLENFNLEETKELIKSRLRLVDCENYFSDEIIQLIYDYSKGIPRNIISACGLLVNLDNGDLSLDLAKKIFQSKYIEQLINDRVEDTNERLLFNRMVNILKEDFNNKSPSQEEYVKKIEEKVGISRVTILKKIDYLERIGVFRISRGGYNRVEKIISIE